MRILSLFGKQYAVGLWWQIRPGGPATRKNMLVLARQTAQEFTADAFNCVAVRPTQYGLAHWEKPVRNVLSLAAALRPLESDSFIGLFQLEQGLWWVCAVSKGVIGAEGDVYFDDKQSALAHLDELKGLYRQASETVCESPEASQEYLAKTLRPDTVLTELVPGNTTKRRAITKIAVAVTVIAALVGAVQWSQYREDQAELQTAMRAKAAADHYKREIARHPERFFPVSWLDASPMAAGKQCLQAILEEPLVESGWSLDTIRCVPGQSIEVTRQHNKLAPYTDYYSQLAQYKTVLTPQQVTITKKLGGLPRRDENQPLLDWGSLAAGVYQLTQNSSSNLQSLSWLPPGTKHKDGVQLIAPWQSGKFEISDVPSPFIHDLNFFSWLDLPGLKITAIIWQNRKWTIQGEVYARP